MTPTYMQGGPPGYACLNALPHAPRRERDETHARACAALFHSSPCSTRPRAARGARGALTHRRAAPSEALLYATCSMLDAVTSSSLPAGSVHVLKTLEVTTYGSQLDDGRR